MGFLSDDLRSLKMSLYKVKSKFFRKLKQSQIKSVRFFIKELNTHKIQIESHCNSEQRLPHIINFGILNGNFHIFLRSRYLRFYRNVTIYPNSSFIFQDNNVEIPKRENKLIKLKAKHSESFNAITDEFLIIPRRVDAKAIKLSNVFSLVGHYSSHFGHFLLEYFERLEYLPYLNIPLNELTVLVHKNSDSNILELVNIKQKVYGFQVLEVEKNAEIVCESYYHIDPSMVVCDGANYCSITDKLYYPSIKTFFKSFMSAPLNKAGKKVFLSRIGKRNLINLDVIEKYFQSNDYLIIKDLENYSIESKKELFSSASYIVGPMASAFFNCIWCPIDIKIMIFVNYEIAYDNVLQNVLNEQAQVYHLAGKEENYQLYNSDYLIPLIEIQEYSKKLGFTI